MLVDTLNRFESQYFGVEISRRCQDSVRKIIVCFQIHRMLSTVAHTFCALKKNSLHNSVFSNFPLGILTWIRIIAQWFEVWVCLAVLCCRLEPLYTSSGSSESRVPWVRIPPRAVFYNLKKVVLVLLYVVLPLLFPDLVDDNRHLYTYMFVCLGRLTVAVLLSSANAAPCIIAVL